MASPLPRPIRLLILNDRAIEVWRLADQQTTALESTKVGASVDSTTGVPLVVMATQPVPWMMGVEQAARHHAAAADEVDVDVEAGVVGEDVAAVDRHGVALEVDEVDVGGLVGEEDLGLAGDRHGGHALAVSFCLSIFPMPPAPW